MVTKNPESDALERFKLLSKKMELSYLEFCPSLNNIIATGKSIDENNNTIPVSGLSSINNIKVLREIILAKRPHKTLEIGLAYGGSALAILASLQEIHKDNNFLHTAIDPFQKKSWKNSALTVLKAENLSQQFRFIEDFSYLSLPQLVKSKEKFYLIYVDGSHLFEDVFIDFYYSTLLLEKDGIILFDDCADSHVRKLIKFIKTNYSDLLGSFSLEKYTQKSFLKKIVNRLGYRQMEAFKRIGTPPRGAEAWNSKLKSF
ncbi:MULTISPECIES: class I SAM-dependent methyltransferase [unclassified Moorena]|uniref:class I SAM-dependent methyltransferase n=1 Tax=unclassified Moorena TaxID=2683338 RepID=UPI0013BE773C|nr:MULTISPECIES: class I SAM-dependent methyltransferase [unclassified Moorena]NEQ07435.1 class I SAM-dependent methyltransferase [Moorena sp. SIO4E2]